MAQAFRSIGSVKADVAGCTRTAELAVPVANALQTELSHAADCRTELRRAPLCPGCPQYAQMVRQHRLHNAATDTHGRFRVVPFDGAKVAEHNRCAYKLRGARKDAAPLRRADELRGVTETVRAPACDGFIAQPAGQGYAKPAQCVACTQVKENSLHGAKLRASKPRSKAAVARRTAPDSRANIR